MELVENPYVSEFTRKTLEQFGWKENDPIPADLGGLLLKLKSTAPASARTDVLVDVAVLPEEAIQNIQVMLSVAKKVQANRDKEEAIDEQTAQMAPEVAALYRQLADNEPTIVDDRDEVKQSPAAPTPVEPAPAPDPAASAAVPTEPQAAEPPMIILPFCPRCGWDMRQKFDIEIIDLDKEDFLSSVLGGTRFERRFSLMGGKVVLRFRSLLAEENRLIHRQLVLDQESKDIVTESEWFLRLMEYRLACSLERVENGIGRVVQEVPTLGEMPHTPPEGQPLQTALVPLLDFVNNKVLAHEVTRRLAGQHFRQFQRLVEALEAMALEPSFWNGIG